MSEDVGEKVGEKVGEEVGEEVCGIGRMDGGGRCGRGGGEEEMPEGALQEAS